MKKLRAKSGLLNALMLRPCHWDDEAAAWSRLIPRDAPELNGETLSQQIKSGGAKCYEVVSPDGEKAERVAIVICRVDRKSFARPEFVIIAAYSIENQRDLMSEFLPELEEIAAALGCATIRFHTMRPGLIKRAQAAQYRVCEVICRKSLHV